MSEHPSGMPDSRWQTRETPILKRCQGRSPPARRVRARRSAACPRCFAPRIVNGVGDVVDVSGHDPNLLHAAQVSIGLLGVMTQLELEVVPRYRLVEENRVMSFAEVAEKWDELYPDGTTEAKFHELEYMVPATSAQEAVELMRDLQLHRFTEEISPLQIRWQKGDQAYLSPQYERDSVSVSVSGVIGRNYEPFLRAVDHELQVFDQQIGPAEPRVFPGDVVSVNDNRSGDHLADPGR